MTVSYLSFSDQFYSQETQRSHMKHVVGTQINYHALGLAGQGWISW